MLKPTPPPPHTRDTLYCLNYGAPVSLAVQVDSVLGTLNWYLAGVLLGSAPVPSTATPTYPTGTTWYVSQTVGGCRGDSAAVTVKV